MMEQRQESEWILRSLRLKCGCTKDLCCHLLFFAILEDVVTELAKDRVLSELLYADDIVLMSETIEGLSNTFLRWKEAFENMCFDTYLWKTKVMVSSGITKDGMSKSKSGPCGICSLRVKAISVLCIQCGMWIHSMCAGVKRVTAKFSQNF